MRRVICTALAAAILALFALAIVGCGEEGDSEAAATSDVAGVTTEKFSTDLLPELAARGQIDVIVQADPQFFFREATGAWGERLMTDPAVIWKAGQEGAVIWKFTPEQAVIWKQTGEGAVIWKFVERLEAAGFAADAAFESIHAVKMQADLATVVTLAEMAEVSYITPDRTAEISALNLTNLALGMNDVATRTSSYNFTGVTGEGVAVAVIDSGIDATQGDFGGSATRIVASRNFSGEGNVGNVSDGYGHGTHVAGLVAGNGAMSYTRGYNATFEGVAPKAKLVVAKALTSAGAGPISGAISALEWIASIKSTHNIRVVNMSLGLPAYDAWDQDPLCQAVQNAVNNGLVVVTAAGNYGYARGQKLYGGIASPGITPGAITVGASNSQGTVKRHQDENGKNDQVALFSSRGPTAHHGYPKPDVVAPGVDIVAALARNSTLAANYPALVVDACTYGGSPCGTANASYFRLAGTSMATPLVAGAAALMLQANPSLTPNAVKALLMITAEPMFADTVPASCYDNVNWRDDATCVAAPAIEEGAGLLNPPGAVYLAQSVSQSTSAMPVGSQWSSRTVTPISYYTSTGDGEIWSQGVVWTGIVVFSHNAYDLFQAAYASGQIWGQGVVWTGMRTGADPVWNPAILALWFTSFVSPTSLGDGSRVLGGYNDGWAPDNPPVLADPNDECFPEA